MSRIFVTLFCFLIAGEACAAMNHGLDHPQIFQAFTLEAESGKGRDGTARSWDLDGWIGSDLNRLWLKSEKKDFKKYENKSEIQALYSRNVGQFWDAQIGLRHDFKTDFSSQNVDYVTLGMEGIAPYFFETDAHIFLSDAGNFSARLKQEIDLLITQKLIAAPYFEADFFAQDVEKLHVASGLSELEIGVLTRYEISRKFAPYFSWRYNVKTFGTKKIAQESNQMISDFITSVGLRLKF